VLFVGVFFGDDLCLRVCVSVCVCVCVCVLYGTVYLVTNFHMCVSHLISLCTCISRLYLCGYVVSDRCVQIVTHFLSLAPHHQIPPCFA
jgi:hypothetical protein